MCAGHVPRTHFFYTFARMDQDAFFMRRCLQLAAYGRFGARPNPMVGAVIVARGRILGEGWHRRCGGPHAEVNAFAAVAPQDEALLGEATIYVSLEPCAHWGRTPPCAELIARKGVRRCVAGTIDPFAKVQGRGMAIVAAAGIETRTGVLEAECRWLNRRFFTFHTLRRPYIILKWAQTADGFLDDHFRPAMFSNAASACAAHKLRAEEEAILVGRVTDDRDHPALTTRHWAGPSPRRLVLSRPDTPQSVAGRLWADGVQSLIVEGGGATLASFIQAGLWDAVRVETAPTRTGGGTPAPAVPAGAAQYAAETYGANTVQWYRRAGL